MQNNHPGRRRNHFIKKGFQINFSIRFLALVVVEAILLGGLFWYMSLNTLTTSYAGAQLRIENTSSFFFPSMMLSNLIVVVVVGLVGLVGLIFISHKIAGPLYRFEKSLKDIGRGDLSHRITTRKNDQLTDLADTLNDFTSGFDSKIIDMKSNIRDIEELLGGTGSGQTASELHLKLQALKRITEQFKTSRDDQGDNDSKGQG